MRSIIIKASVAFVTKVEAEVEFLENRLDQANESQSEAATDQAAEYEEQLEVLAVLQDALNALLERWGQH